MIDCIIPTIAGREESLERLLDSLQRTTESAYEPLIVRDSVTCGWGWKTGLERSQAPYIALLCDDQEFLTPGWDVIAMETTNAGYLPCPRVMLPDGRYESQGGDMKALHHLSTQPKKDGTPVDYTVVPFLSREQLDAIGLIPPTQYAGDVFVSYRGRQLGYETVLRHYDVRHWQEVTGRGAGMAQNERDAMDCKTVFDELDRLENGVFDELANA